MSVRSRLFRSRIYKAAVPIGAAFLLTSIGGAGIYASPLTLPILGGLIRRSRSFAYRILCTLILTLTLAEVGWFVWYSATRSS